MPIPYFPPPREADLVSWSANFATKISATPVAFGLTAAQATAFSALNSTWASAYTTASEHGTNSSAAIIAKNTAKQNLLNGGNGARQLVAIVRAFPTITKSQLADLGIRPRDVVPTPVPPPARAPDLSIVSVAGRTVKIRMRDAENPDRRGKPVGVQGASVMTFVGAAPPADPLDWSLMLNTSRTVVDLEFPSTVPAGSLVWISAFWFNARKQTSPAAAIQSTNIAGGLAMAA